jgi:hypothetical protein
MKKILVLPVSVFLLALENSSSQTFTSGDWTYTLNASNEATIIRYNGAGGAVVVPVSISNVPVKTIGNGDRVFGEGNTSLTSAVIPNGVTSVGHGAFDDCSALTNVTIGDTVQVIGAFAFEDCAALTNVLIPASVTSIGDRAFQRCFSLTSIGVNASNLLYSSIDGVLFDKSATKLIEFPAGKSGSYIIPDGVTIIGDEAFMDCKSLTNVLIPASVTSIGEEAFQGCFSLASIGVNASNLLYSSIGGALFDKSATKLIAFPAGKSGAYVVPDGVETIGKLAFHFCESLTSVTMPGSLRTIEVGAFYECAALASANLGAGVEHLQEYAFAFCESLTNVTIPDSVTSIGQGVFQQCISLPSIEVASSNPAYASIDGVLFDKNATTLVAFPAGRSGAYVVPDGVQTIAAGAFHGCLALTGVTIPESVTSIGETAFRDCIALTNITIPDSVEIIGERAFKECVSLASGTIGNGVNSIGDGAFEECTSLQSLYFLGNAPEVGFGIFDLITSTGTVYYVFGTTGWDSDFANWPTEELPIGPLLDSFGESQVNKGRSLVMKNPSLYNLFTQAQYNSNRSAGRSDVISNPASYNLYTADSIMDLRMGGLMIQRQGSSANIVFQPQTTTDLATQPFTNNGTPITNAIPMPGNKGFIRINAKP